MKKYSLALVLTVLTMSFAFGKECENCLPGAKCEQCKLEDSDTTEETGEAAAKKVGILVDEQMKRAAVEKK